MEQKSVTEMEMYYKARAEPIPLHTGNDYNNDDWKERQYHEKNSSSFECSDLDYYYQQNSDLEMLDDSNLFNDNFHININNQNEKIFNPNKSINQSNSIFTPSNENTNQLGKNIEINSIEFKNNQSQEIRFPFLENQYFQGFFKDNQEIKYYNQSFQYFPQNKIEYEIPLQINTAILFKKTRKRRGTGDEAQRKHPNDDFKFENKPCYHFLVSISNNMFRSKCTFSIINKVANIIEQLNPRITKRTRMERRRKSVQLCWFHNNWIKIYKMKEKIIEQLTNIENQNQADLQL